MHETSIGLLSKIVVHDLRKKDISFNIMARKNITSDYNSFISTAVLHHAERETKRGHVC